MAKLILGTTEQANKQKGDDPVREIMLEFIPQKAERLYKSITTMDMADTDFAKLARLDEELNRAIVAMTKVMLDSRTKFRPK